MKTIGKIAALCALLCALGCEKESKQIKEDAPDASQAAKPADAPLPDAAPACEPLTLTEVKLPCINLASVKNRDIFTMLRSQADLDALYASSKGDAPECQSVTPPSFNWDEVSVIGVSVSSGGCKLEVTPEVCAGGGEVKATIDVAMVGLCEMVIYSDKFYTVPKIAADAKVDAAFKTRQVEPPATP